MVPVAKASRPVCASLMHFVDIIEFQASIRDASVGRDFLSMLDPGPEHVLRCAVDEDGATRAQLQEFVQYLKLSLIHI